MEYRRQRCYLYNSLKSFTIISKEQYIYKQIKKIITLNDLVNMTTVLNRYIQDIMNDVTIFTEDEH